MSNRVYKIIFYHNFKSKNKHALFLLLKELFLQINKTKHNIDAAVSNKFK